MEYVNSETGIFGSLEDFEDLEEDPLSGSVLDEVNIYDFFKSAIGGLQQGDQNKYQVIVGNLSQEDQNVFVQLMNI